MLVQEPRGGSSLKIIAAVLGVLLCADLIARIPFGSLLAGPEPAVSSTTGVAAEAPVPQLKPIRSTAREPQLATATAAQPAPAPSSPKAIQQPDAAAPPRPAASPEVDTKTTEGLPCEQQTWPYIDSRCKDTNAEAPPPAQREVRVIGKDSTAPATVVTPLPTATNATQPQLPREAGKIDSAASPTAQSIPSAQPPAASTVPNAEKPADATTGSIGTAAIDLPRPAPQRLRKAATAPVASDSAVQESTRSSERSGRRATNTNVRKEASRSQKLTSKRNTRSEPSDVEETSWGREENSWGREETSRARNIEPRRTAVTESRAYQLPSGRRIIVFRQSNGEIGIAPARQESASSFFFR